MKAAAFLLHAIALFGAVRAQSTSTASLEDPGPSPTESVGCEPHDDHWHCDAPATAVITAADGALTTETLPPSPTESVGCEAHGDHWDCEAPATAVTTGADGESITESIPPSPTESTGCELHGDHWHCDAPATAASEGSTITSAPSGPSTAAAEETSSISVESLNAAGLNRLRGIELAIPGALVGILAYAL